MLQGSPFVFLDLEAVLFVVLQYSNLLTASSSRIMLSIVASASLSLNIGSSALTSARAAPSMVAAMETSFVYSPPKPLGTTSGVEYPNTVHRLCPQLTQPSRPAARVRHTTST